MADVKPVRVPLVEPLETRDATTFYDAKAVNCVTEKSPKGIVMARKRPGLLTAVTGTVGIGQGVTNYLSQLYSISGDTLNILSGVAASFVATNATPSAAFTPRVGPMVAGFNGNLYVMGGTNSSGTALNDVWRSADGINWIQVTNLAPWAARAKGQLVVLGNTMYLMGGAASATGTHYGDVWSTVDGINWTQLNPKAWPGRRRFASTIFQGKIWISGGAGVDTTSPGGYTHTKYSDVWSSSDGIHWTQTVKQAPWIARSEHVFYSVGSLLYVLGGLLIDAFSTATGDLWSSPDGVTWTRVSSNPFNLGVSGLWPVAAFGSTGQGFPIPSSVTVGAGTATAWAFTDFDDDGDDDDFAPGPYMQVTVSPGSNYTAAPALTFGTDVGVNANAYSMLNGTANGGSKALRVVTLNGTVYILEVQASGTYDHILWSTTDGVTITNTGTNFTAGWPPRDGEFFAYGNLWFTSGIDATPTYYNDVWEITLGGGSFPLGPNNPGLFYHFNQTSATITSPLLVFKSTQDLFTFNAALNLLTKLSNVTNYPDVTVPGLVVLDTQFYVMDPQGRIWNSNINDPTTWSSLAVIAMQNEPTGGVAIAKLGPYVVAFGQWTTEFFYDNASPPPGSPLAAQTSLPFDVGCANGESVREMQGNIVWVGQTKVEGQGVYTFQNFSPTRISTPFVDRILQSDPLQNVTAFNVDASGYSLYVLTLHTSNITLIYNFMAQMWTVWTSLTPKGTVAIQSMTCDPYGLVTVNAISHGLGDGDPVTIGGAANGLYNGLTNAQVLGPDTFQYLLPGPAGINAGTATLFGYAETCFSPVASAQVLNADYLQDPSNGVVYSQNFTSYADTSNPINVRIVTERIDEGTSEWKNCRRISLLGDMVPSNCMVAYTDTDYQTYSLYRPMSLNSGQRATLTPGGRFRRRAFQIRHTAFTPFRAAYLELELILGGF
jgi:hypothetical protein